MAEPSASSASNPSYEDLAEAWNTICQLLGADGPDEAIARIQTLTDQMEALDNREDLPDELITLSEFEQVLTRLHQKIADLRARNNTLEDRLNTLTQDTTNDASAHALLDALDAPSYQDALDHIQALKKKAEAHSTVQGVLQRTGHDDIASLIDAAKALQRENDHLRKQAKNTAPDTEVLQSASAIRMVLGISNIEEAETFVGRLDALSTSVRRALDHLGMDVPAALSVDRADNVASYLDVLASQIERLAEAPLPDDEVFEAAETLNAIETTLGISSAEDAREMEEMVRSLTEDLDALAHEREVLREEGLTAEEAVSMIHSMEDQLDDLYVNQDVNASDNGTLPPGLKDTLGVESIEEAQRVVEHTKEMDTQIAALYEEQEQLNELGIDSIDEAIRMIRDMNDQLVELYEDVEARSEAQALPGPNQDTFQQLESLYARQEKLQSELGISDPEAIIQMVEDMNVQLETLYEDRDASLASSQDELVAPEALNNPDLSNTERLEKLIDSMARQLDVLYGEKETLSEEGFSSADEAAERIADLRDEIQALRNQKAADADEQPDADVTPDLVREWRTLKNDLGVSSPDGIRALIESSHPPDTEPTNVEPADAGSTEATLPAQPDDASPHTPGPQWSAGPALADAELRAALPTMDAAERDALDVAAIQLDVKGQILTLNDAAYALPMFDRLRSKEDAIDTAFFFDVAPSAATDAFYGRFHTGLEQDHLDARFPHLFTASSHPPFVALVHLFYDDGTETAWVLLRTA